MSKQLVKERVIKYLMEDLLVPHDMIDTDVALSEFEEGAEGIIDIIVSVKDKEDYLVPVMLVSCLDEDVKLEGEVVQKQIDFSFLAITSCVSTLCFPITAAMPFCLQPSL